MFVVIFEVQPKQERWDDYLKTAGLLRPILERIDGFIENERFRSERTEGRLLSLSTWRDEKALIRWRTQPTHYLQGQVRGRSEIFADYHLRVSEVTFDSEDPAIDARSGHRFDTTEVGVAPTVSITIAVGGASEGSSLESLAADAPGLVDRELYDSITTPGKRLLLTSWIDDAAAERGIVSPTAAASGGLWHRRARVIRDYGMRDRREAPQYFEDVP